MSVTLLEAHYQRSQLQNKTTKSKKKKSIELSLQLSPNIPPNRPPLLFSVISTPPNFNMKFNFHLYFMFILEMCYRIYNLKK